ncbi:MAG: hypothetical protein IKG30_11650 [Clostridiales bacterium]|nr:hypothetical protein [Clostridiales bacterium]
MTDNREKTASDFREEIKHAFEPGAKVMSADRELRYCLELQRNRIAKRNLKYKEEMVHKGPFPDGLKNVRSWRDVHYETSWTVDYIDHNITIQRDGLKTYKHGERQAIYETVVDVRDGEDVSGDDYCCPNCGAVSTISELQEGCRHCGTSFKMSELYPKVANYFFVYDVSGRAEHMWLTVLKYGVYSLPVNLIMCLYVLYTQYGMTSPVDYFLQPFMLIRMIMVMGAMLPIFGYFAWIFDAFRVAAKSTPVFFEVANARKKFASRMSMFCPEFTFESFAARIVSLLKIVAYSDNRDDLPTYSGKDLGTVFDNVVDISFLGSMSCKSVKERNGIVYVTGDVYVKTTRDLGDRIKTKDEIYRVKAGRRIDSMFNTDFAISKLQCNSCGASFDALKTKKCPFCGSECNLENNDWVIYDIRNVELELLIKRLIAAFVILWLLLIALLDVKGLI